MPPAMLHAFDAARAGLRAAEQLDALAVAMLAAGRMPERSARALVTGWEREAGGPRRRAERPRDRGEMARGLGARGIGLRVHQRPPDGSGAAGSADSRTPAPKRPRSPRRGPSGGPDA
jgi:hypothetical protein